MSSSGKHGTGANKAVFIPLSAVTGIMVGLVVFAASLAVPWSGEHPIELRVAAGLTATIAAGIAMYLWATRRPSSLRVISGALLFTLGMAILAGSGNLSFWTKFSETNDMGAIQLGSALVSIAIGYFGIMLGSQAAESKRRSLSGPGEQIQVGLRELLEAMSTDDLKAHRRLVDKIIQSRVPRPQETDQSDAPI